MYSPLDGAPDAKPRDGAGSLDGTNRPDGAAGEIPPPEGIQRLWSETGKEREDVEAVVGRIVARAVNEARGYERMAHGLDVIVGIVHVLLIVPLSIWAWQYFETWAGFLGAMLYVADMVVNIWCYRRLYVDLRGKPAADAATALYVQHYVRYQDLRAKFLRDTMKWAYILLCPSAILFVAALVLGDPAAVGGLGIEALVIPLGWWMTRYETGKLDARKAGLRDVLEASERLGE